MDRGVQELTRLQAILLQAVLPIFLIGIALPIGLVALVLWLDGASASEAIDHGELFIAGGNAAFTGCLVLVSARPDKALGASIVSMFVCTVVVIPCYVAWALISTADSRAAEVSADKAMQGGWIAAAAGLLFAVVMVVYAYFSPRASTSSGE
jgi:hypothetical protein